MESPGRPSYPAPMAMRRLTDLPAGALARALFAAVPDGILVLDGDGVVLDASDTLCDMLGHSRAEIVGQGPPHPWMIEPSVIAGARRFTARAVREGAAVLVRRDGTTMPATVRTVPLEDGGGQGSVVVVERAPVAPGLPAGGDEHRAVVAAIHEGVVTHGPDGVIRSCNPSAERILRAPATALVGRTWAHWRPIREDGTPVGPDDDGGRRGAEDPLGAGVA